VRCKTTLQTLRRLRKTVWDIRAYISGTEERMSSRISPIPWALTINGFQSNYILPAKDFVLFFEAPRCPQKRTIVFGGSWTLKIAKPGAARNRSTMVELALSASSRMVGNSESGTRSACRVQRVRSVRLVL
jgi:hypothetical protein